MNLNMKTKLIPMACLLLSVPAMAWGHRSIKPTEAAPRGQQEAPSEQREQGAQSAQRVLSFDEIRLACQNPARFHNQTAPTNIQISCRDTHYHWVPSEQASVGMKTSRLVTTIIQSDKYNVSPQTAVVASPLQMAACDRFQEVADTVEIVRAVSCDDLLSFKGSAIQFCDAAVTSMKQVNQEAGARTLTGRQLNLCDHAEVVRQDVAQDQSDAKDKGIVQGRQDQQP